MTQYAASHLLVRYGLPEGSPPAYAGTWTALPTALVDRIEINAGDRPSRAVVRLPYNRWSDLPLFTRPGTLMLITTAEPDYLARAALFQGFVTDTVASFSGDPGSHDDLTVELRSYRWLLHVSCPVVGQVARGPDDYTHYGTDSPIPVDLAWTDMTGRRCIFNESARPNRDPNTVDYKMGYRLYYTTPIFCPPDWPAAEFWTARQMIQYLIGPLNMRPRELWPIADADLPGLEHEDFDTVINHVVCDGLSVLEALALICTHLGWSFREDYIIDDGGHANAASLVFFKCGAAADSYRADRAAIILHELHVPAVGEDVPASAAAGRRLVSAMQLRNSIADLVNTPWGLGAPDRFEFTAELVPAWPDADLDPDFEFGDWVYTDAELALQIEPNLLDYYRYYHAAGAEFRRLVGRKWVLNETGRYSRAPYDRGDPFDFSTVVDAPLITGPDGRRLFGPFARRLLECLTRVDDSQSAGILVQFSFDGGLTWQVVPGAIENLPDEAGIYITQSNLAHLPGPPGHMVLLGDADYDLNLWTSLLSDRMEGRSFKLGQWLTRVRVTASVQLDQRLIDAAAATSAFSSPFEQIRVHDWSDRYGLARRMPSSVLSEGYDAEELDSRDRLSDHLDAVREAYQDASISGLFVLDRLWTNDGRAQPVFKPGDGIARISGRQFNLRVRSDGERYVYPEIIQIIYSNIDQRQHLVTRDLRYARPPLT